MGDYSDLLAKVQELKKSQSKHKKEKRLVKNMKMLVKDSNELSQIAAGGVFKGRKKTDYFATFDHSGRP